MRKPGRLFKNIHRVLKIFSYRNSPSFLIIGAQKAGTDALFTYLNLHDNVSSPFSEVDYFSSALYARGSKWYNRQFLSFSKKVIHFEKTPEYLYYPEVPQRIFQYNPNLKLIALLRNPIDRAYSGWNHYRKYYYNEGSLSKSSLIKRLSERLGDNANPMIEFLSNETYSSFEESIEKEINLIQNGIFQYNPSFVRRGLYAEQLRRFYKFFSKDQLLIIESSELKSNTENTLNTVFRFIGLDPIDLSKFQINELHKSDYKGLKISEVSREVLNEFYKPYNEELFQLLGRRFQW